MSSKYARPGLHRHKTSTGPPGWIWVMAGVIGLVVLGLILWIGTALLVPPPTPTVTPTAIVPITVGAPIVTLGAPASETEPLHTPSATPPVITPLPPQTCYTNTSVWGYQTPLTNSIGIRQLEKVAAVTVIGETLDWYQIDLDDQIVYLLKVGLSCP